eukprot:PhM_4_TR17364/c0_g1_i1/m.35399
MSVTVVVSEIDDDSMMDGVELSDGVAVIVCNAVSEPDCVNGWEAVIVDVATFVTVTDPERDGASERVRVAERCKVALSVRVDDTTDETLAVEVAACDGDAVPDREPVRVTDAASEAVSLNDAQTLIVGVSLRVRDAASVNVDVLLDPSVAVSLMEALCEATSVRVIDNVGSFDNVRVVGIVRVALRTWVALDVADADSFTVGLVLAVTSLVAVALHVAWNV